MSRRSILVRARAPRAISLVGSAVANEISGEVGVVVAELHAVVHVQTTPGVTKVWPIASVVEV